MGKLVILDWLRDVKESGAILRFMAHLRLETAKGRESVENLDSSFTFIQVLVGHIN